MATLTYLVGPPASGKRTIGLELSAMTGAALIDNHMINDPVFAACGADGRTPLPEWVWDLVEEVREATLTAVSRAAPTMSHILTNYLASDPSEQQLVHRMRNLAETRGARFVPVWLTCSQGELLRRVTLPERAAQRVKMRDDDVLRQLLETKSVLPPADDALVLDTSTIPPDEAAKRIIAWSSAES